jgi:hypothetical protein
MVSCLNIVSAGWLDVGIIRHKVAAVKEEARLKYKESMFNKHRSEINYHNLAVDNTLDIIDRLEARFITGAFDPEPRAYKNSVAFLRGDDDLFK